MRRAFVLWSVIPLLAACGGGAGSTSTAVEDVEVASLAGKVTAADGTSGLAGTSVSAPDAGVDGTCDANGDFDLGDLPAARTRIRLRRNGRPVLETWIDLTDSREMHVRLVLDGDRIVRAFLRRCRRHGEPGSDSASWNDLRPRRDLPPGEESDGIRDLGGLDDDRPNGGTPPDGPSDDDGHRGPRGDVGAHHDDAGHMGFAVVARGLTAGASVEVVLTNTAGDRLSLGTFTVDGEGRLVARFDGDALPFGATHVRELAGVTVEVLDAVTGDVLLSGEIPELDALHPRCDRPDAR